MIEVELVQPAEQPTEQLHILIYVKELEEEEEEEGKMRVVCKSRRALFK